MIFRANVRDKNGQRGKVYFTAQNITAAQSHISANFPHHAVISIQSITNAQLVISECSNAVTGLHQKISKAYEIRQTHQARITQLLAKKTKTTDELDELVELHDYVRTIDSDMKLMREKVVRKQQLVKDIGEMQFAETL